MVKHLCSSTEQQFYTPLSLTDNIKQKYVRRSFLQHVFRDLLKVINAFCSTHSHPPSYLSEVNVQIFCLFSRTWLRRMWRINHRARGAVSEISYDHSVYINSVGTAYCQLDFDNSEVPRATS